MDEMGRHQTLKIHSQHRPMGLYTRCACADPESFVRGGPTLTTFILVDEGEKGSKYHYKRAIIGSPAKRHLNGVCWHADVGSTFNAGLVAL